MARIAQGSCIALASLALAGCAGTLVLDPGRPAEVCDVICQVVRLFDEAPSPPLPLIAAVPEQPAPPKPHPLRRTVVHPDERRAPRSVGRDAGTAEPSVPPEPEAAPTETVAEPPPPVPPGDLPPLRTGFSEIPTMEGSTAIAPPWFEPWPAR